MLQKDVHPYEYMDDKEKFNETSLPEKEEFYRHLNMDYSYYWCKLQASKNSL